MSSDDTSQCPVWDGDEEDYQTLSYVHDTLNVGMTATTRHGKSVYRTDVYIMREGCSHLGHQEERVDAHAARIASVDQAITLVEREIAEWVETLVDLRAEASRLNRVGT